MKLRGPSLMVGPTLSDTERRNSFDNILTQSRQVDGQNKREGKVRSVKRGIDGVVDGGGWTGSENRKNSCILKISRILFDIFF